MQPRCHGERCADDGWHCAIVLAPSAYAPKPQPDLGLDDTGDRDAREAVVRVDVVPHEHLVAKAIARLGRTENAKAITRGCLNAGVTGCRK